jgi:hypothetical protein
LPDNRNAHFDVQLEQHLHFLWEISHFPLFLTFCPFSNLPGVIKTAPQLVLKSFEKYKRITLPYHTISNDAQTDAFSRVLSLASTQARPRNNEWRAMRCTKAITIIIFRKENSRGVNPRNREHMNLRIRWLCCMEIADLPI